MNSPLRVLLVALLLVPPRVCRGEDPPPAPGDEDVAAAQNVSKGVGQRLQGIGSLTVDKLPQIYGERPVGDPGSAVAAPLGTRASANAGADLPASRLPVAFNREAAPPPAADGAAPARPAGVWGAIRGWFTPVPPSPPSKPVDNPTFTRSVPCADGKPGCVRVMTISQSTANGGSVDLPITDFVDYGTLKYKGKTDDQIWDTRPWWKFWQDPRQVSPNDVQQGQLGDCYFLASLAAISSKEPDVLRSMIKQQQGSLAVWVQFFDGQPPKPVMVGPVDDKFVVYKPGIKAGGQDLGGQAAFAAPSGEQGAIWPVIVEKAYAIKFRKSSYAEMQGGFADEPMTHITGRPTRRIELETQPVSFDELAQWDSNSQPMVVGTKHAPDQPCPPLPEPAPAPNNAPPAPALSTSITTASTDDFCQDPLYEGPAACLPGSSDPVCRDPKKIKKLVTGHEYWIKSVDKDAQSVTIANPWGSDQPTVTWPWSRFQKSLRYAFINEKAP